MTDITKETNHTLAPVPGDSKSSGNELLLRFFQSDWFTPAVSPVLFRPDNSYASRIWRGTWTTLG